MDWFSPRAANQLAVLLIFVFLCSSARAQGMNGAYERYTGNCVGNAIGIYEYISQQTCQTRCDQSSSCAGYSYSRVMQICYLKGQACPPVIARNDTDFHFHRRRSWKTKQAFDTILKHVPFFHSPAPIDKERVYAIESFPQFNDAPCQTQTPSNIGTEFVVVFMHNLADRPRNFDLELYVTTDYTGGPVTVEVSTPAYGNVPTQSKTVTSNDVTLFKLPDELRMKETSVGKKGVYIRSVSPASAQLVVYGINKDTHTSDGFLGLPIATYGTEYFVFAWSPATNAGEFAVAASQDDTTVLVAFSNPQEPIIVNYEGRRYTNGDTMTINLQKFNTFLAINENSRSDITGTKIVANKPISVFCGNVRTSIEFTQGLPSRDHLVEQAPPVAVWGRKYMTLSTPHRSVGDYFKIIASQPNTKVTVSALGQEFVLQSQEFRQIKIASGQCSMIEADKPILVVMFTVSQESPSSSEQGDPSAIIIPPIDQWSKNNVFATTDYAGFGNSDKYKNYVMIGMERDMDHTFELNSFQVKLTNPSNVVGANYVCGYIEVPHGRHVLAHGDKQFMAVILGLGDRESYGFPVGMQLRKLQCLACKQVVPADKVDNDCDGVIDEELCNGLDDDKDGEVDEDCSAMAEPDPNQVTPSPAAPNNCRGISEARACYGDRLELKCSPGQEIALVDAHFGRVGYVSEISCNAPNPTDCAGMEQNCGYNDIHTPVSQSCAGRQTCNFSVNRASLGSSCQEMKCPLCIQYALVHYRCIETAEAACFTMASRAPGGSLQERYTSSSSLGNYKNTVCNKASDNAGSGGTCSANPMLNRPNTDDLSSAYMGRMASSNTQAWCPSQCDQKNGFLQVDMGGVFKVTGYIIQGRRFHDHYVTSVTMAYSSDGTNWTDLRESGGPELKILGGNVDAITPRWCDLAADNINARYIRVFIRTYNGYPCMHFDLIRCNDVLGCQPKSLANTNMQEELGTRNTPFTVKCIPGWAMADGSESYELQCNNMGVWEGPNNLECTVARGCGDIPSIQGALHNGKNTKIGSRVSFTCMDGRRLQGEGTIVCQNSAEWTPLPSCTESAFPFDNNFRFDNMPNLQGMPDVERIGQPPVMQPSFFAMDSQAADLVLEPDTAKLVRRHDTPQQYNPLLVRQYVGGWDRQNMSPAMPAGAFRRMVEQAPQFQRITDPYAENRGK